MTIIWVAGIAAGIGALLTGSRLLRHPHPTSSRRADSRRFDGERSYVTRGGAWVGDAHAAWPTAELAVDSTSARLRSRPGGLFQDIDLVRGDVDTIVVQRGKLGNGIAFRDGPDQNGDLVFWPTDAGEVLDALRERGWPVGVAS